MRPITEGLPSKRKRIPTKWPKPIRPSPITGGKRMIGILEYWKNGIMGLKKRFAHHYQYSIIPFGQIKDRGSLKC
jgi:hypothetical protein